MLRVFPPLHNKMLCDLLPREREDLLNSRSSTERNFFYQILSIEHTSSHWKVGELPLRPVFMIYAERLSRL